VDVLKALNGNQNTVAMLAPSIVGQFPGDLNQIAAALKELGFSSVEEVAAGADETVRREGAEWKERITKGAPFMTTSCCPAYIEAVKKHVPALENYVSHTPSPMAISGKSAKESDIEAVTVFIGPCLAKRTEALRNPNVDYVLTFEEIGALLIAAGVDVQQCEAQEMTRTGEAGGRGFPVSGGVTEAIRAHLGDDADRLKPVVVNGLDSKALMRLKMAPDRGCGGNFMEVMCCEGGCLSGPGVLCNPAVAGRKLTELLSES
jgi:iron only hydrogenase large subunit-like protein